MLMNKYVKHFITICKHKYYVAKELFSMGLYWQGIVHDISKFSPTEFGSSAKYFNGKRSPIEAEKAERGYSLAWLHHKSHNKHHWQYWVDYTGGKPVICTIPKKYLYEMAADIVGASKAYLGGKYNPSEPLEYFMSHKNDWLMKEEDKFVIEMYLIEKESGNINDIW
jgi:hypothetical protein